MTSHTDLFAIVFYFGCVCIAFCVIAFAVELYEASQVRKDRRLARAWKRKMERR